MTRTDTGITVYQHPPKISSNRVRARKLKRDRAIIGGIIGFLALVAIIATGFLLSGVAGAVATAEFAPAVTEEAVILGYYLLAFEPEAAVVAPTAIDELEYFIPSLYQEPIAYEEAKFGSF